MLKYILIFFLFTIVFSWDVYGQQQEAKKDSVVSPFRKKRWLTGIGGSILSSTTNEKNQNHTDVVFSNHYSVHINLAYFVFNSLSVGFDFNIYKNSASQFVVRNEESMTFGPQISYYLSRSGHGSVLLLGGASYGKYFEENRETADTITVVKQISGDEWGGNIGLGYSHVILDKLAFNVSMMYDIYKVKAKMSAPQMTVPQNFDATKVQVRFVFGFSYFLK